jgi:cell division protein FtsB
MKSTVLRFGYGVAIAIAIVFAFVTLRGPNGLPELQRKRQEIRELEQRNVELERENRLKRERIHRLTFDSATQEMVIRERLGKYKPSERVWVTGK